MTKPRKLIGAVNSVLIGAMVFLIGYALFSPVDVLTNWTISVPSTIYIGEEFDVQSKSTKKLAVTGYSNRAVECANKQGKLVTYPISGAKADKQPGDNSAVVYRVVVNNIVPDLPTTCAYTVNVCYTINPIRTFCEFNRSNNFTLAKREVTEETETTVEQPVQQEESTTTVNNVTNTTTNNAPVSSPEPAQATQDQKVEYVHVCDPLVNILGIKLGEVNCHTEPKT